MDDVLTKGRLVDAYLPQRNRLATSMALGGRAHPRHGIGESRAGLVSCRVTYRLTQLDDPQNQFAGAFVIAAASSYATDVYKQFPIEIAFITTIVKNLWVFALGYFINDLYTNDGALKCITIVSIPLFVAVVLTVVCVSPPWQSLRAECTRRGVTWLTFRGMDLFRKLQLWVGKPARRFSARFAIMQRE